MKTSCPADVLFGIQLKRRGGAGRFSKHNLIVFFRGDRRRDGQVVAFSLSLSLPANALSTPESGSPIARRKVCWERDGGRKEGKNIFSGRAINDATAVGFARILRREEKEWKEKKA